MVGKLFLILVAAAQLTATSAFAMNGENPPKGVTRSQPRKLSACEAALKRHQEEKLAAALVKGQHVRAEKIRNGNW